MCLCKFLDHSRLFLENVFRKNYDRVVECSVAKNKCCAIIMSIKALSAYRSLSVLVEEAYLIDLNLGLILKQTLSNAGIIGCES